MNVQKSSNILGILYDLLDNFFFSILNDTFGHLLRQEKKLKKKAFDKVGVNFTNYVYNQLPLHKICRSDTKQNFARKHKYFYIVFGCLQC